MHFFFQPKFNFWRSPFLKCKSEEIGTIYCDTVACMLADMLDGGGNASV